MLTTKRILLVGFIALQTVLIFLLGTTAIIFRNEVIKAKAEANYYHNELKASHENHKMVSKKSLVKREKIKSFPTFPCIILYASAGNSGGAEWRREFNIRPRIEDRFLDCGDWIDSPARKTGWGT